MKHRVWITLFVLLCCCPWDIHAQVPVIDVADIVQNTVTAIETTLTTIETILIEANQILDLTSLDDIEVASGIAQDMQLLGQLVEQAQGLSYDVSSLESQISALFDLGTAPTTTSALQTRLAEIRRVKWQCYSYALRVQTLLRTALRTVEHLQGLLDTVSALIGNKQGHQTHMQATTVAAKHLANLDVQIAAFHRAQSVDKMEELLTIEALRQINQRVYERTD